MVTGLMGKVAAQATGKMAISLCMTKKHFYEAK